MKKGLSQICLGRDYRIKDALELAKSAGYEGLEVILTESGDLNIHSTSEDYRALLKMSRDIGVEYCSLCGGPGWEASLTSANPSARENHRVWITRLLEAGAALGVDAVLVVIGRVTETVPYDAAYQRALEGLKALAPVAEKLGVSIAVENVWNMLLLSPLEFKSFLDEVGSEYVGAYFDTGNVVINGYPEQWIRILARHIKKVHFKDFRRKDYQWVQLMEGDVNWKLVMESLRKIGYDGYAISEVGGGVEIFKDTCRIMNTILSL